MDEEPKITCTECRDLEFARNLVRQMKEGYGRHNSNLSFRDQSDTVRAYHARRAIGLDAPYDGSLGESEQARVVGRFCERTVKARWEACDIGDYVGESHWPESAVLASQGVLHLSMIVPIEYQWAPTSCGESPELPVYSSGYTDIERRTFERVRTHMTDDGGRTWNDHYFWKRIS